MHPGKSQFVTACQQLLALGVVFAVLAPASSVISLDVVSGPATSARPTATSAGKDEPALRNMSMVETEQVEADVTEVELTAPATATAAEPDARVGRTYFDSVVSDPQAVEGYGAVGITWSNQERSMTPTIELQARTLTGGTWSEWTEMEYHDEHGPDPDSDEGRAARPGTDALLVGNVDEVQVRVNVDGKGEAVPADMKLAVITPGESDAEELEAPAIDTAKLDADEPTDLAVTD